MARKRFPKMVMRDTPSSRQRSRAREEYGEDALRAANQKFERRFRFIEQALREAGRPIENCPLAELDALWGEAKKAEKHASCG